MNPLSVPKLLWVFLGLWIALPTQAFEGSRFQRTVFALQTADDSLRQQFASIALLELTEIYLAEADLARSQAEVAPDGTKLRSWSRAVEQYADQLVLVIDDIELGFPAELRSNTREVPSVTVSGRTVMLAHPRNAQQPAYERAVLSRFCTGNVCNGLTATVQGEAPIPMSPDVVSPGWEFSTDGPVCRHGGLALHFSSGGELARQRSLCLQMMQEAELLATELAWQQRHSVTVEWSVLQIKPTPQRPEHLVILNSAGDSLLLTIPLFYGTPGLLAQLTPWLQQRYKSEKTGPVRLQASALGWE